MAAQNRFNPTDQELVKHYLYNIVHGNPPPTDDVLINIADVYGDSGWKILFEFLEKDRLYFFTRLTPRTGNGSRVCRVATEGIWKNQHRPKDIYDDDGKIIGSKLKYFSFIPNDVSEPRGIWVMHEYRLKGRYIDNLNGICRIKKMGRNGSTTAIDEEALSEKVVELENVIRGGGEGEGGH